MNNHRKHSRAHRKKMQGIIAITKSGAGYLTVEDGDDIYIHHSKLAGAMDGDTVEVLVTPGTGSPGRHPEGEVTRILERSHEELFGILKQYGRSSYLVPMNPHIKEPVLLKKSNVKGVVPGDRIACRITRYPTDTDMAEGILTERIAKKDAGDGTIRMIIRESGLKEEFPKDVEDLAHRRSEEAPSPETLHGRRDLRHKTILTIDGKDSKDLDDAVSIDVLSNGNYVLGVHIADVANYVTDGDKLDREALKRGTSVYLLTTVLPMLPRDLSNGICSLFEGEDRLTLSVMMEIDRNGTILSHEIYESIIRSRARMVYDDVSDMLENEDPDLIRKYSSYGPSEDKRNIYETLCQMAELYQILQKARMDGGSLDFDLDEAEIELYPDGHPRSIKAADRRIANRMIEEFMLAANRTVAEHYCRRGIPFVYRVHDKPDPMKIEDLSIFLGAFGIHLKAANTTDPKELNDVLRRVKGKPYESIVSHVLLKSMTKAYYSPSCDGHFGLAFPYYCHFTSPIRRYPDLMVHRIIKLILHGSKRQVQSAAFRKKIQIACDQSSLTERRALDMEREVEKLKKAEYMTSHIGEHAEGTISGVTSFGVFVSLDNTVEGLVRMESLSDDYYIYDEKRYRLIGTATRKIYALGDRMKIVITHADPESGAVDFIPDRGEAAR
jgi:ribonuclease R